MNKVFDIIVPVAAKDIDFVPLTVSYLRRNIIGANKVYVITNQKNISKLKNLVSDTEFYIIDENTLLESLSYNVVRRILFNIWAKAASQTGWYFQQLLKFAFAHTKYAGDYYLTWDADSLPLNAINFFNKEQPLFTKKIEYHEPYFDTIKRLIGIERQVDYSFIAEHMLFKSEIVRELTAAIEQSDVDGNPWFEKILNACDFSDGKANLFSEFETYGNYCAKYYPSLYGTRTLNTFRAAGLIRGRHINDHIIERLSLDLHIASFEMQDAPFPYNIGWNLYKAKRKLSSILHRGGGK